MSKNKRIISKIILHDRHFDKHRVTNGKLTVFGT